MVALTASFAAATITVAMTEKRSSGAVCYAELSFPSFLPKQVENIKDTFARKLATRIDRLPVPLWKSHIKRPMILVGPSLGAAVAIDFVANHPEAVEKLVLIDASVYAEGTGDLVTLPRIAAYAGRLHCELPNATIRQIPDCGHPPHVERPNLVAKLIVDIVHEDDKPSFYYLLGKKLTRN